MNSYTWNSTEMEVADASKSKKGSVLIGGEKDNQLLGGKGNDVFVGNEGSDVIQTNEGKDIIIVGADDGNDIVTDYNPKQDVIEFTDGISRYSAHRSGNDTRIEFKNRIGKALNSITLQGFTGELGEIREASIGAPSRFENIDIKFKQGEYQTIQWFEESGMSRIEFEDGVRPKRAIFSFDGQNSSMIFQNESGGKVGGFTFRGAVDPYKFSYYDGSLFDVDIEVQDAVTLGNGVELLPTHKGNTIKVYEAKDEYRKSAAIDRNVTGIIQQEFRGVRLEEGAFAYLEENHDSLEYDMQVIGSPTHYTNRVNTTNGSLSVWSVYSAGKQKHNFYVAALPNGQHAFIVENHATIEMGEGKDTTFSTTTLLIANEVVGSPTAFKLDFSGKEMLPEQRISGCFPQRVATKDSEGG